MAIRKPPEGMTEDQAGWNYPSPGICEDNICRGVRYPWHDEYTMGTPTRGVDMGYCSRCGERRPEHGAAVAAGGANLIPPTHQNRPSPEAVRADLKRRGYSV